MTNVIIPIALYLNKNNSQAVNVKRIKVTKNLIVGLNHFTLISLNSTGIDIQTYHTSIYKDGNSVFTRYRSMGTMFI